MNVDSFVDTLYSMVNKILGKSIIVYANYNIHNLKMFEGPLTVACTTHFTCAVNHFFTILGQDLPYWFLKPAY